VQLKQLNMVWFAIDVSQSGMIDVTRILDTLSNKYGIKASRIKVTERAVYYYHHEKINLAL
jgi:hypothetical protein